MGEQREQPLIHIDPIQRIALISWGTIEPNMERCIAVLERMKADSRFEPDFGVLGDHRLLARPPSPGFIVQFVEYIAEQRRQRTFTGRVATVTSRIAADVRGMAHLTEAQTEIAGLEESFRAFNDIHEAMAWLSAPRRP